MLNALSHTEHRRSQGYDEMINSMLPAMITWRRIPQPSTFHETIFRHCDSQGHLVHLFSTSVWTCPERTQYSACARIRTTGKQAKDRLEAHISESSVAVQVSQEVWAMAELADNTSMLLPCRLDDGRVYGWSAGGPCQLLGCTVLVTRLHEAALVPGPDSRCPQLSWAEQRAFAEDMISAIMILQVLSLTQTTCPQVAQIASLTCSIASLQCHALY